MVSAPARREQVRCMVGKGLSQRRALAIVRMSASAYRYAPRPDHNVELRERIVALAQRHRRYGVGMIHLKLRQGGMRVNYKRVERLYQEAMLQVRRRRRKKVQSGERQPLVRPVAANQVWSMDFVFDRTAEGRVIKCLTIVDDATHEAVTIEVERAISGLGVTRVLDRLALSRGLPQVIRTDNGKEFCGKAMVIWGIHYHQPRTLDQLATESGGTSGVAKRPENRDRAVTWHVAMRPGQRKALPDTTWGQLLEQIARQGQHPRQGRAPVPNHQGQFGFLKTRYRGLKKNTAQLVTLFALANLFQARHRLMPAGAVRSGAAG
jgi:hypothetical protein